MVSALAPCGGKLLGGASWPPDTSTVEPVTSWVTVGSSRLYGVAMISPALRRASQLPPVPGVADCEPSRATSFGASWGSEAKGPGVIESTTVVGPARWARTSTASSMT